ncbi:hypothetical protein [Halosegnis sp.]|uniref:DUF7261 family protein n=1 Tax=Halosegnis sp. TaxID=2864959 RepID=UPI0035D3F1E5
MSRDRGQLLLVGALALAISFVAVALILNSAIYTHNLASRSDGEEASATFARDARLNAGRALDHANRVNGPSGYSAVQTGFIDALGDLDAAVGRYGATDGRLVAVTHVAGSDAEGVRVADTVAGGSDFMPAYGDTNDWTVATGATVRSYDMRVQQSNLVDLSSTPNLDDLASLSTPPFVVEFDDGTTAYRVGIYDDSGITVLVSEVGSSDAVSCTVGTTTATVSFSEAELNNDPCEPLTVLESLDDTVTIRYLNPGSVTGSYKLVVDRVTPDGANGVGPFTHAVDAANHAYHCGNDGTVKATYNGQSGSYPRVTRAIYESRIRTTHDSARSTAAHEWRIAPHERVRPQTPRATSFVVAETANDNEFDVSWSVTDPNGDSVTVTAEVTEQGDDDSNPTKSISEGPVIVDDGEGPYTFRLTLSDGSGNTRTVTQTHAEDSDETGCPA